MITRVPEANERGRSAPLRAHWRARHTRDRSVVKRSNRTYCNRYQRRQKPTCLRMHCGKSRSSVVQRKEHHSSNRSADPGGTQAAYGRHVLRCIVFRDRATGRAHGASTAMSSARYLSEALLCRRNMRRALPARLRGRPRSPHSTIGEPRQYGRR